MTYPIKRTPEEGHTKKCLAQAMITVIENWRDASDISDTDFRSFAQAYGMDYGVLAEADEYLRTGQTVCYCEPISLDVENL